ncbi:MAG: cell division protein SepF [Nitrososphaerales archaeon]
MTSSTTEESPAILLKAFPLKNAHEVQQIKEDVKNRTIVILKITPLAKTSIDELKDTIEQLTDFTLSFGGDIARLGEERIVITPPGVRIWRGERNPKDSGV